jgi:hypothetical protein
MSDLKKLFEIGAIDQSTYKTLLKKLKQANKVPEELQKVRKVRKMIKDDSFEDLIKRNNALNEKMIQQDIRIKKQEKKEMKNLHKTPLKNHIVSSWKNSSKNHIIYPNRLNKKNVEKFLSDSIFTNVAILKGDLTKMKNFKVYNVLKVKMMKHVQDSDGINDVVYATPHFHSDPFVVTNELNIVHKIKSSQRKMLESIDKFTNDGSGWVVDEVIGMYVNTTAYRPLRASSYIDLPRFIKNTKACVNVQNKDDKCFSYAILSCLYPPADNPQRPSKYNSHMDELNMENIEYPVAENNFSVFEKQNDISINVLRVDDDKEIVPWYTTIQQKEKHVNILKYKSHYVWIKDMSALFNHTSKHANKRFYCFTCLTSFYSQKSLDEHIERKCETIVKKILPNESNNWTYFKDHAEQMDVPFVIYADFECITKPVEDNDQVYQNHEACSWAYKVVSRFDKYQFETKQYRGPDAAYKFVESLIELSKDIDKILSQNKKMIISAKQEKEFNRANNCHICNQELGNDRVRDHCHITGLYRGPAHNKCNLLYNYDNYHIPVFFHNLKGYDSHLIIRELGKFQGKITCIPQSSEKFISFQLDKLVFKDSMAFMNESLSKLVSYLNLDKNNLLFRKGVYPYDYMDSLERFDERGLPKKEMFYSKLTNEHISDEDYEHAQKVWLQYNIEDMGEYADLYLMTDVELLSIVFESFRKLCKINYGLDPAHYYTTPGLSWASMLNKTHSKIELFTDVNDYDWIQSNVRGGISSSMKRYAKANNKYLPDYDEKIPSSFIVDLDANNQYGWAMSQPLPISDYCHVRDLSKFTSKYILGIPDDNIVGYILEVDLHYPKSLHDKHNFYPLAPENIPIKKDMLSEYCQDVLNEKNLKFTETYKLTPNLFDKKNYVVHYRALKLYLQLGLKITKVHRVMQFTQSAWLKPYIDFNTEKRTQAKNDFEKNFYKLMNNSIYGKTMENVYNRINYKLVQSDRELLKETKKPNFQSRNEITPDLMGVSLAKSSVTLNKNILVGFSILDLSKVLMYDFYYNTLQKKYDNKVELLYTDTDSLILHIQTDDVYDDLLEIKDQLDFSDYPIYHKCYDKTNKKVIGKFKDESNGKIITEFVGLRSKMYSYIVDSNEKNRCKGINKSTSKNFTHEMYKQCIDTIHVRTSKMNSIRSFNHNIQSITETKNSLSSYDDKRYMLDSINSYAYGHYKIYE